ncbi:MAG TPA: citrate synthase [Roseiarcus sp.]
MSDWLTADEAMMRLRLKPQTLYAYVSRGLIEAKADDEDSRRSLYRAADVGRLAQRKSRGRKSAAIAEEAIAWGEPVLASAITTIARGKLWYRGEDAEALAGSARLEDVARLLWACGDARFPPKRNPPREGPARQRMFEALATRAAADAPTAGRAPSALYFEAASVLDALADAVCGGPGAGPIHDRLAEAWGCGADGGDLIRRCLVLLADHELNASTFAARVTASTGASLAASALAGLSALSGPLHGGMAARVAGLVAQARREGAQAAIRERLASGSPIPGFAHPLYPGGDPRARALFAAFDPPRDYVDLATAAFGIAGVRPNVDFALCAVAEALGLPDGAPFQMFALARSTGWIAHALEQLATGRLIRPRARYVGPPPAAD